MGRIHLPGDRGRRTVAAMAGDLSRSSACRRCIDRNWLFPGIPFFRGRGGKTAGAGKQGCCIGSLRFLFRPGVGFNRSAGRMGSRAARICGYLLFRRSCSGCFGHTGLVHAQEEQDGVTIGYFWEICSMHEQLSQYIRDRISVNEATMQEILSRYKPLKLKRNELLLSEGEPSRRMCFVVKGCLRVYFIKEDGTEVTRRIVFENAFSTTL